MKRSIGPDSAKEQDNFASKTQAKQKTDHMLSLWRKIKKHPKLILATFIIIIILSWQPIADNVTISDADPNMVSLAQKAGMSRKGELIFLRTHPRLDSDSQIESDCASLGANFNRNGYILQGCYDPNTNRIYIRQMPSDYANLEVATAAYETLHPIYQTIKQSGDSNLDNSIENEYGARSSDKDLAGQVAVFAKTEPGARDDELFSILGTQYSGLSANLANYYTPYFDNLAINVDLNKQIEALIPNLQSQIDQLNDTINQDDSYASTAYANSVSWARAGNSYEDNYNYNIYVRDLNIENQNITKCNQLIQQLNTLITEYSGSQPVAQKQTVDTQQK